MTREEIMNSTPVQLAERYTEAELRYELEQYAPDNFDYFIGRADYHDFADELIEQETIDWNEQLLVEWYDEDDRPRPIDAETLSFAYHLWAASCFAYDREKEAEYDEMDRRLAE